MEAEEKHRWSRLLTPIILAVAAVPASMSLVGGEETLQVMVIGDSIPDPSFFFYDPCLAYRVVPYPTWAQSWTEEETSRWLRTQEAARSLVPADFIIELPYGVFSNQAIDSRLRSVCDMSIRLRAASILLPVPATALLAHFAPDETRMDTQSGNHATKLPRQNKDILGGRPSTQFAVKTGSDPLTDFAGVIDEYHDANLFVMEEPDERAEAVATVQPWGILADRLGGETPWLLRLDLSCTPSGSRLRATGYVWKCASPINGVFFFPHGGYVATQVAPGAGYVSVDNLKIGEEHEYAWDIISNVVLHSARRGIPDLLRAHQTRTKFARYYTEYADAYRALEFAETVSSSSQTYRIWVELAQIGTRRRNAAAAYRSGLIEESDRLMEKALDQIESTKLKAQRALRLALLMINMAMYGVTGATLLIALSVTLHLVCKPRMRRVPTTRPPAAVESAQNCPQGSPSPKALRGGLNRLILMAVAATAGVAPPKDKNRGWLSRNGAHTGRNSCETVGEIPKIPAGEKAPRNRKTAEIPEGNNVSDPSGMWEDSFPYRSLSSVASRLLPEAEELHSQGMSWKQVAGHLKVSPSALFVWRRLRRRGDGD